MQRSASANQAYGYQQLCILDVSVRRSASLPSLDGSPSTASSSTMPSPLPAPFRPLMHQETPEEIAARKACELKEDIEVVEIELRKYEAVGLVGSFDHTRTDNIVDFWSVSTILLRVLID